MNAKKKAGTGPGPLWRHACAMFAGLLLCVAPLAAQADAASLKARHAELREQLRDNNFQRPLHIESAESAKTLQGDVYAVLEHPFEKVRAALSEPAPWCDIMILPFNTKYCHAVDKPGDERLVVRIGRKYGTTSPSSRPSASISSSRTSRPRPTTWRAA
jgi:hypothetical protein